MFKSLDFLYVPAPDTEESVKYYTQLLAGELLWKIHGYGVWVGCVSISKAELPYILLADHIQRNDVMLIYQVENLDSTVKELISKGWKEENRIEIPPGPCCTFHDPAVNGLVIYENKRPYVMQEFKGKIDSPPVFSPVSAFICNRYFHTGRQCTESPHGQEGRIKNKKITGFLSYIPKAY